MTRSTLRSRLRAVSIALALGPALVVGGAALLLGERGVRARATEASEEMARALAGEVRAYLLAQQALVEEVSLAAARQAPGTGTADLVAARLSTNRQLRSILLADRSGRVRLAFPEDPDAAGLDLSREPYFRAAVETGTPRWAVTTPLEGDGPAVALATPGPAGTAVGYLDVHAVAALVQPGRLGSDRAFAVVDTTGAVVAASAATLAEEHVTLDMPLVRSALRGEEQSGAFRLQGREWMGSAWPVPGPGWAVLVSVPMEEVQASIRRLQLVVLLLSGTVAAAAAAAATFLARRLVRPVEALSAGIRQVTSGAYRELAGTWPGAYREIDEVADGFRAMAEAVRSREEALARSEQSYRDLVDTPLLGVARARRDGTLVFCNHTMACLLGARSAAELMGAGGTDFLAQADEREAMRAELGRCGRVTSQEVTIRARDGEERTLLVNLHLEGEDVIAMAADVSALRRATREREQLERRLLHGQRLEAMGRLAGGIAHDLNNLLTAIVGFAAALQDELGAEDPRAESAQGILEAAQRAGALTHSLLAYGRKQHLQLRPLDLCEIVRGVERLLRPIIGEDVQVEIDLPGDGLPLVADHGHLEQALVNLCTNARDAMPGGGRLRIVGDEVELSPEEAAAGELSSPGRYVRLRVVDSGRGMAPEVMARAFEPFYTTKARGAGTGLGLSIVYGTIRQHGGDVRLESHPGQGTCVTLLFPRHGGAVEAVPALPVQRARPRGTGRILLAEDEPLVRRAMRRILEGAGYEVVEAADGQEAVERFQAERGRIALCLFDVIMPRKNGREAAEAVQALSPGIPILFASGYTADLLQARGVGDAVLEVIAKPVTPAELLRCVGDRLERARAGQP